MLRSCHCRGAGWRTADVPPGLTSRPLISMQPRGGYGARIGNGSRQKISPARGVADEALFPPEQSTKFKTFDRNGADSFNADCG